MALSLPSQDDDGEAGILVAINTTPLVDVMLVLLIIFLITIPVVSRTIAVTLPQESAALGEIEPGTVAIAVDAAGVIHWNETALADDGALRALLAGTSPQTHIHVHGDHSVRFAAIDRVLAACREAGITRVSFVTRPEDGT